MEDLEIVALFLDRSENAIKEADLKYGRYCYSIANRILNNEEDAKEVVNDTYLKAWNTIPPNEPDPLSAYLGMISRQTAINKYKERNREKRGGGLVNKALDELAYCIPESRECDIVDKMFLGKVMNAFLDALPKKTRMIFMRRYWYMDSIFQIASSFNMSESSVKMTLLRTRSKLKKYLKEEGIDV